MQFWLLSYDKSESLQLPVEPSSFQIAKGNNNTTVTITTTGELNLIGKGKLATITIETFFPAQEYDFCQYTGFPTPYECTNLIDKWRQSSKPMRIIITDTDINMAASIETFTYGEQDGTGDVYFTLELKEYRFVSTSTVAKAAAITSTSKATKSKTTSTRQTKAVVKTYTIKKGDTLWAIAKRLTGSDSNYKSIASKNGIKNPNLIHVGQKLVIS